MLELYQAYADYTDMMVARRGAGGRRWPGPARHDDLTYEGRAARPHAAVAAGAP